MIKIEAKKYNLSKAQKDFESLQVTSKGIVPLNLDLNYQKLRNKLIEVRDYLYDSNDFDNVNNLGYKFDLLFGIEMYELLNDIQGFNNRVATNNDFWSYLSIRVIPDIVHARWSMNPDRFYRNTRRIWLKVIWWYIHLSWYENKYDTYDILENNSTDTIAQLVERPGIGYNIGLYREIMKQYATHGDSSRELFRSVLKLNTAKLVTTSPELVEGGIKNYVNDLYSAVGD